MPNPSINQPVAGDFTTYEITNSNGALVNLSLTVTMTPSSFTVKFPIAAAPTVQVTLQRGAVSHDLLPGPITDPPLGGGAETFTNRKIVASTTDVGGQRILACDIQAITAPAFDTDWIVKISGLGGATCAFTQPDNFAANTTISRIACDPVAGFKMSKGAVPIVAAVREQEPIDLTADDPYGPPANRTFIGAPAPVPRFRWTYAGNVPIPEFDGPLNCQPGPAFPFIAPAVFGSKAIQITEEVWYDSPCPTAGFLKSTSPAQTLTVQSRPHNLMLVLDRSGSMSGSRWDNAVTAARMLINIFTALRAGISGDNVGVIVFEDHGGVWRAANAAIDPAIAAVPTLGLAAPATVNASACSANFNTPGSSTPIGDGLIKAMEILNPKASDPGNPLFTIVLLTDGFENSGRVGIKNPSANVFFNTEKNKFTGLNIPGNLRIFTIGMGSMVESSVLNQISVESQAVYLNITDASQLKSAITQMSSLAIKADLLDVYAGLPPMGDPDSPGAGLARYFHVEQKARRVAVVVERDPATDPTLTDTLEVARFDALQNKFVPFSVTVTDCKKHLFFFLDLAAQFGGEDNVPGTDWRIIRKNTANVPQAINVGDLLVFVDLFAHADFVFDKLYYETGDPIVITARLRAGNLPIRKAKITVELVRPKIGYGSLLAEGAKSFKPGEPQGRDHFPVSQQLLDHSLKILGVNEIPTETPPDFFKDATDQLFDDGHHGDGPKGDGNYANIYQKADMDGTYTLRFRVEGVLEDGDPFTRVLTVSKWIGPRIDSKTTIIRVDALDGIEGRKAGRITVFPRDPFKNPLGPFEAQALRFDTTAGRFLNQAELDQVTGSDGVISTQPDKAATFSHFDGRYERVLIYRKDEAPVVTVSYRGRKLGRLDLNQLLI